jgi:hypothetical protein
MGDAVTSAHVYREPWRIVAGTLLAASGTSLPVILLRVMFATDPPITPPVLVHLFVLLTVVPAAVAWLMQRAFAAEVEIRGDELVVRGRDLRLEIPCSAIARVEPWAVPLPGPGLWLRMGSGRRLSWGIQAADPTPLLAALADPGGVEAARAATAHPILVWAHARHRGTRPPRWYHLLAKFPLFALLPAGVLFNAHQHIAYGALLGEYYLLGLASWLRTLGAYWVTVAIYLVLYASVMRGLAEAVALVAARVAPSRGARVRRGLETACRVLYFGGVPVVLGLRFLPW